MLTVAAAQYHVKFENCLVLGSGYVHSAYCKTVNILVAGELYSVYSGQIPCAPYALQLHEYLDLSRLGLRREQPVCLCAEHITMGESLRIRVTDARIWKAPELVSSAAGRLSVSGLRSVRKILENLPGTGAMGWYKSRHGYAVTAPDVLEAALHRRLGVFMSDWLARLVRRPVDLLGVGHGLTPSGDDFLCGFYFTLVHLDPEHLCLPALREEMERQLPSMSEIGRQMFRAYLEGEGNEVIYRLLNAILTDDIGALPGVVTELLGFGSTSGMDLAAGVLAALDSMAGQRDKK